MLTSFASETRTSSQSNLGRVSLLVKGQLGVAHRVARSFPAGNVRLARNARLCEPAQEEPGVPRCGTSHWDMETGRCVARRVARSFPAGNVRLALSFVLAVLRETPGVAHCRVLAKPLSARRQLLLRVPSSRPNSWRPLRLCVRQTLGFSLPALHVLHGASPCP